MTLGEEQPNSNVAQNSLLHWESLLVVSSRDPEDVALPLISEDINLDFRPDSLLIEDSELVLIVLLKDLLGPRGGNCHVQLHVGSVTRPVSWF